MIKVFLLGIFFMVQYAFCSENNYSSIRHYSVTNGLKSNRNVRVIQDKHGFYWFGTSKGLQRFDGYEFKEFPVISNLTQPPASFEVYKLFLTADSGLLVGTSIGLLQFDELHNQFIHIAFGHEHSAYRVIDICRIDDSTYFVNSFRMKGVCVYHANRMVVEPAVSVDTLAMNNPKVSMFVKGHGTTYFVRIANDIYEYDLEKDCHVACKREAIPSDVNFHYGFTDKLGVFWLLTEAGLYYKPLNKPFERFKTIDTYCALDKQIGSSIIPATDSSLFVAFDWWGVVEISIKTKRVISIHRKTENQLTELPSNQIYSLFATRDGNLWWCNDGAYLLQKNLGDSRFIESGQTIETKNYSVLDILQDSQNRIWVATDGGGLHQYLLAENKTIPASKLAGQHLPDVKVILALHEDTINHDLWIGTYGDGLYRYSFSTKSSEHFNASKSNGIKRNVINAIGQDRVGDILVSSLCQSLSIYDHKTKLWSNLTEAEGALRDNCVMKIVRDQNNMMWLGYAEQGFDAYYEAVNKKMLGVEREINGSVLAFGFDGDTVWMGGSRGVLAFDRYRHLFLTHPICKAFTNIKVSDVYVDSQHRIWVASSDGLYYFTASDTVPYYSYLNTFFKKSIPKRIIETHDFHLLIGGANGLLSVPTISAANNNELAFSLHLTDVRLFGKSLALTNGNGEAIAIDSAEAVELDYNSNSLGLSFSTLNIALNDIIGYQVKVDNLYSQWQALEPDVNHFELPNLQPGTYVVRIRAFLKTNSSIYQEKRLTIVIVPPLWQRFWFRLLVSFLVVALVTAYIYIRYLNLKREQAKLERLVAQRTESLRLALETINESKVVIEAKNQELQETLQMKDKLIGVLGHDFKNPLAAIQGLLEITKLQLKVISPEKLERNVDSLIDSTQRLSEQMITVFDWAQGRQQKMSYHPVDINPEALLIDVISLVKQNAIQKNISITTQIACTHNAMVDVRMIHTVFRNLLTNAIKFTPKNASIVVLLNEDDAMIEVVFIDSGIGMDAEQLRNVFDNTQPYSSRGTNNEPGSGFGLQVCKQFIEQNNGTFSINSTQGKGSVFTVRLPKGTIAETLHANSVSTGMESVADYSNGGEVENRYTILLIDDNEDLLTAMQTVFEANFDVLKATDGAAGLYFAQNSIPDIIVCDVNLPSMTGLEVCSTLHNDPLTRHIPVMLVSGENNQLLEAETYSYGAADFIAKPFNIGLLKQKVHTLLQNIQLNTEKRASLLPSDSAQLPEGADDIIIRKIIDTISQNMENSEYNVDVIAQEIGLSRTQFWRKTKSILGKSPSDLLRDLRLKRAAEMLQSGKYRVSEVAYSVGFTDPRYFSRCFSKNFGQTPSEYFERYRRTE